MNEKRIDKKKILDILQINAQKYENNLNNKEFLILFKNGNNVLRESIIFSASNFLHLTGLKTNLSPLFFYNSCLDKRLSTDEFDFKYNEQLIEMKMHILPYLTEFYKVSKTIGNYNNNGFNLNTDKIIGNTAMSIGVVYESKNKNYLVPNSLIKADSRTLTQKPFKPIIAILSKKRNAEIYNTITYKSKNINIDKLHFPKEIRELLTENALYELKPSLKPQEKAQQNKKEAEKETSVTPTSSSKPSSLFEKLNMAKQKANEINRNNKKSKLSKDDFQL